ncbi:MAG TPA: T9SS type A sorting domain-containing protein [Patescibacteria group bacterium]|nr:T9SS type A sorting domain-containing protein [Patescibacteria group bacterium]
MKHFLSAVILFTVLCSSSQAQMQLLKITKTDGTVKVMRLAAVKNITFTDTENANYQLSVKTKNDVYRVLLSSIESMKFLKDTAQKYSLQILLKNGQTEIAELSDTTNFSFSIPNSISEINNSTFAVEILPNPFKESATIKFTLQKESHVRVEIFDESGKSIELLKEGILPQGPQTIEWRPQSKVANGAYFVQISIDNIPVSKILLKGE